MDIHTLANDILEELCEALIVSCRRSAAECVIQLACDDAEGAEARRRMFELACTGVRDAHVAPAWVGSVDFVDQHPLLLEHSGPQAELYFSCRPAQPAEVFYLAHKVLAEVFQGWRDPSNFLHGDPEDLLDRLAGGYGLLARGPMAAFLPLQEALAPLLPLNVMQRHDAPGGCKVLLLGCYWVVCEAVSVTEVDAV